MSKHKKINVMNNICWMLQNGWSVRKSVLILYVVLAFLALAQSLAELFLAPQILERVEQKASVSDLLLTIVFFTLLLQDHSRSRRVYCRNSFVHISDFCNVLFDTFVQGKA